MERGTLILWRGMEVTGVVCFCVVVTCVQVLGGAVLKEECAGSLEVIGREFGVDSSQIGGLVRGGVEGDANLCTPAQSENVTLSSLPTCCPTSLVEPLLKNSTLLLSTFNNSEMLNRFREKMSVYETLISSHESSNVELWNATIEGLRVLKGWGNKYWDPLYLERNNVFSNECLRRVVGMRVCGGCGEAPAVRPCKSLCHNVVLGCLKSPLAEFIESSWKHAVNSVRTAIRLVITTGGDAKQNTQPLQDLVADLNDWREPITWWMPEYKRTSFCESLPTSGCWNGESVGKYEFGTASWKSQYNPEFSSVYRGDSGLILPNVILELDRFRGELAAVRKTLEKYWPTTLTRSSSPHALALSSSESISPPRSSYIHDFEHEAGSGDDTFESDDEDLEYVNSGYGSHIETDDEDLDGYGSGAGSGDKSDNEITLPTDDDIPSKVTDGTSDGPPVSLSSSSTVTWSIVLVSSCVIVFGVL